MIAHRQEGGNGSFLGAERSGGERSEPERSGAPKNDARPSRPSSPFDMAQGGVSKVESPEVSDRPTRRRFTAAYKLSIVQEADRCTEWGQIGALLRREGLYHSHLDKWRKQRDTGALDALNPHKRGPKAPAPNHLTKENEQLRRENARLEKKLKKAEMVIEFQKKVAALLEMDPTDDEGSA